MCYSSHRKLIHAFSGGPWHFTSCVVMPTLTLCTQSLEHLSIYISPVYSYKGSIYLWKNTSWLIAMFVCYGTVGSFVLRICTHLQSLGSESPRGKRNKKTGWVTVIAFNWLSGIQPPDPLSCFLPLHGAILLLSTHHLCPKVAIFFYNHPQNSAGQAPLDANQMLLLIKIILLILFPMSHHPLLTAVISEIYGLLAIRQSKPATASHPFSPHLESH